MSKKSGLVLVISGLLTLSLTGCGDDRGGEVNECNECAENASRIFDCDKCEFGCKLNKEECADCEDGVQVCVNESNIGKLKTCIGGEFKEENCINDVPCKDGESCAECKPGTKSCTDKLYKYCDDKGEWVYENCGDGKRCQNDECVEDPCAKCEFGCKLNQDVCAECENNYCDEDGNVVFCVNGERYERKDKQVCIEWEGYRCNDDNIVENVGSFWCVGENAYRCGYYIVKPADFYGCDWGSFFHCVAGEWKTQNKTFGCVDGYIYNCSNYMSTRNTAKCDEGVFYRCEQNELIESGNSGCDGNFATTCSINENKASYGCDYDGVFSCDNGERKDVDKSFWTKDKDIYQCKSGQVEITNCEYGVNQETGECIPESEICLDKTIKGYCKDDHTYVDCTDSGKIDVCTYKCKYNKGCVSPNEGERCEGYVGEVYKNENLEYSYICVDNKQWVCVYEDISKTWIWKINKCCNECDGNHCISPADIEGYCDRKFDYYINCYDGWINYLWYCPSDNCYDVDVYPTCVIG